MLSRSLLRRTMSSQATVRSTTASGSTVYESARATDEYLQFHFAPPDEILPYKDAPRSGLDFLPRLARTCADPSTAKASASAQKPSLTKFKSVHKAERIIPMGKCVERRI